MMSYKINVKNNYFTNICLMEDATDKMSEFSGK
jgi:hypothetical protein